MASTTSLGVPPSTYSRPSAPPTTSTSQNSRRNFVRQYQTRRWAMMSSAMSSLAGAVEARARDELVRDDVDEAAEGDDERQRAQQRPRERPVVALVEPREGRRAGEDGDEGRGAAQSAPLPCQGGLLSHSPRPERRPLPTGHGPPTVLRNRLISRSRRPNAAFDLPSMRVPCPVLAFRSPRRSRSRRPGRPRTRVGRRPRRR